MMRLELKIKALKCLDHFLLKINFHSIKFGILILCHPIRRIQRSRIWMKNYSQVHTWNEYWSFGTGGLFREYPCLQAMSIMSIRSYFSSPIKKIRCRSQIGLDLGSVQVSHIRHIPGYFGTWEQKKFVKKMHWREIIWDDTPSVSSGCKENEDTKWSKNTYKL